MPNPAGLLHETLEKWINPDDKAIYLFRRLNGQQGSAALAEHRRAMGYLAQIEELLDGLAANGGRVEQYRRMMDRWTKWVLAYPHAWTGKPVPSHPTVSDQDALDMLASLDDRLHSVVREIDEPTRKSYGDSLRGVRSALTADASLPEDLRRHIHSLLTHAEQCLEEYDAFGDFDLQRSIERLTVAVTVAEKVSEEPGAWAKVRQNFTIPLAVALLGNAPGVALQIAQITGSA